MLFFVCVNAGDYLGKGKEYVEILHDMVMRNLAAGTEGHFVCFTDDTEPYADGIEKRPLHGNLRGWWNKLYLFKEGHFSSDDKIVFFDLDTAIVSGLDEIIKYDGYFAIMEDVYRPHGMQSSVILWKGNALSAIWKYFEEWGFPEVPGGDQAFIEKYCYFDKPRHSEFAIHKADKLQELFPQCFVSYKKDAVQFIPKNAKVVIFHGNPRPHAANGWVEKVWKIGGGGSLEMEMICNVGAEQLERNITHSLTLPHPQLDRLADIQQDNAIFVGGGPSACHQLLQISGLKGKIFSLNGSYKWLKSHGIKAHYHVIADARPDNLEFIDQDADCTYLIASHCDPSVFKELENKKVLVWHRGHDGIQDIVDPNRDKYTAYIAGGSTVGMVGLSIAYCLGYRSFHLFGYDSSYCEESGHAYQQKLNNDDKRIEVEVYGRPFTSTPWMVQQANEYMELIPTLIEKGCDFVTYGDGLIQHLSKVMADSTEPETEIVIKDGDYWPKGDFECKNSIENFIDDVEWIKSICKEKKVAIQAGGNVGLWARKLANDFDVVYTFEPDNINFQCLVRNCPEPNIVKLQAALGAEHAMIGLQTLKHNCGAHAVHGSGIYPVLRIDDLCLPACDLIQLDIEGFEYNALSGALVTILKYLPVIVVEMKGLGAKYGKDDNKIYGLLDRLGYKKHSERHRDVVFTFSGE